MFNTWWKQLQYIRIAIRSCIFSFPIGMQVPKITHMRYKNIHMQYFNTRLIYCSSNEIITMPQNSFTIPITLAANIKYSEVTWEKIVFFTHLTGDIYYFMSNNLNTSLYQCISIAINSLRPSDTYQHQ